MRIREDTWGKTVAHELIWWEPGKDIGSTLLNSK
jgi:hypothetical protein